MLTLRIARPQAPRIIVRGSGATFRPAVMPDTYPLIADIVAALDAMERAAMLGQQLITVVYNDEAAIEAARSEDARSSAQRKRDIDIESLRQASVSVWAFGVAFADAVFALLLEDPAAARNEVERHKERWLGLERAGQELNKIAGERAGAAFNDYRSRRSELLRYMERFGSGLAALAKAAKEALPEPESLLPLAAFLALGLGVFVAARYAR